MTRLRDLRIPLVIYVAFILLAIGSCVEGRFAHADDPMNKPLDSLGVFDYDRRLCNDKWNTCGNYEGTSFGFNYPGRSISELGLYPQEEPYQYPKDQEGEGRLLQDEDGETSEYGEGYSEY
jgi:hypothetical protein